MQPLSHLLGAYYKIPWLAGTRVQVIANAAVILSREHGGPEVLNIEDVPDPVAGESEVVVEVGYCGICGSDLHLYDSEMAGGGIVMGLSTAVGEAITLEKGAVVQSNFGDYPILKMEGAPASIDVHFLESGAPMGGLGEPGVPPSAPALANALFAATGKRIRSLPIVAIS